MKAKESENLDTTVVTVDDFSFEYLENKLEYSFPEKPPRKIFEFMAFYRTKPISAITHYGKVYKIINDADVEGKYRLLCFGYKARESATKVIFKGINELDHPVKFNGDMGIQGTHYTKLEYIQKAKDISELFTFREK